MRVTGGNVKRLPAGIIMRPTYFEDATWVDQDDPAAAKYLVDNTDWHGAPGLEIDTDGGGNPIGRRWVYLRLPGTGVSLRANRAVTFCIFFTHILDAAKDPSDVVFHLSLVTADFSPAVLEAMTWNNKLATASDHRVGRLLSQPATIGEANWYGSTNGAVPAADAAAAALTVRVTPAAPTRITGVSIWTELIDWAQATGYILNTRSDKPHRSFLIRE